MSAATPMGAPLSTHAATIAISSSLSDGSSLNCWMPMFLSICQGGISRFTTRFLIDRAHGRTSWYVTRDIGAISPWRWQT